jgi:hypothetical protein
MSKRKTGPASSKGGQEEKRSNTGGVQTAPTKYIDGGSRAKPQQGVNALVTLLDDKVRMVTSLRDIGVLDFVPSDCFDSVKAALKFCLDDDDDTTYVLKAATSCDSLDVTHGTKSDLKEHLEKCLADPAKAKLYSRCVIQPDIWSLCVRADLSAVQNGRLVAGKAGAKKGKAKSKKKEEEADDEEMDALVEWRVYVVFLNHKFTVVDKARECWSSKRPRWHDFIKTPIGIVDVPEGQIELASRICQVQPSPSPVSTCYAGAHLCPFVPIYACVLCPLTPLVRSTRGSCRKWTTPSQ